MTEDNEIIDEDTVKFFVWSVFNFFKATTDIEPEIGPPYLFDNFNHNDYAGIIGVSGSQKGAVYFTMCKELLDKMLSITHPELEDWEQSEESMEEMRMDYSGEMANIVSGNVRNYLGEHFLISVPVVVTAPQTVMRIHGDTQAIVFPISWEGNQCHIVLSLERNEVASDSEASEIQSL